MSSHSLVRETPSHAVTARVSGDRRAVADTLTDVDTLITSMPGLDVSPGAGELLEAKLTVQRLVRDGLAAGAATTTYEGSLRVAELERQQGRIVLEVTGRQPDGGLGGIVRLTVAAVDGPTQDRFTDVLVAIDVIPGTGEDSCETADLARVGRRLVDQFAQNLELTLARPSRSTTTTPTEPLPQSPEAPLGISDQKSEYSAPATTTWVLIAAAIAVAALLLDRVRRRNR